MKKAASAWFRASCTPVPPRPARGLTMSGKYLSVIPVAKTPSYHTDNSSEYDITGLVANDAGNWIFDNVTTDANVGQLNVNCTHTDTKGSAWSSY